MKMRGGHADHTTTSIGTAATARWPMGGLGGHVGARPSSIKGDPMARELGTVAEDGIKACAYGDRMRATVLVAELMADADLGHAAAREVCRLYEEALAGLAAGRFTE